MMPEGRSHLVDFQEAVDLAAFILLFLHLLREPLSLALLDGVCVLEGPAPPPVRLPHIITGVAAPGHKLLQVIKQRFSPLHFFVSVCAGVLLEVPALGSIAALTPVGVQFAGVKHLCIVSGTKLCTKDTKKPDYSVNLLI